jgi:putative transposase
MRKRHSVEQIISILKKVEDGGEKIQAVCADANISEQTFHRWKRKYGGLEKAEAQRLKELEEENQRLKRLVADQALDIQMLKEVNSKKW